jgi:hypothetical protein
MSHGHDNAIDMEDSGKETVPDDGKEKKHFQNNGLNFFLSIYIFLL